MARILDSAKAVFAAPTIGYGRSLVIGAAFAIGWTPCIGPILGAILTLAAESGTVLQGTFLLLAWSLGLGVPFIITGLALGSVMRGITKIRPLMPALEMADTRLEFENILRLGKIGFTLLDLLPIEPVVEPVQRTGQATFARDAFRGQLFRRRRLLHFGVGRK